MMKLFNWCYKSAGIWALGITICLFGLTFLLITPVYDQPDDATMGLVVSGYGNVAGPDEHLIYSNVLIGLILKRLYLTAPLVPWYGAYLLLVQFLAHWILLYALLLLNRDYRCVLGYVLFYLVVGIYCLTHTQFTTTSFLAGMAGLAVILSSLFLDLKGPHCRWLKWIGAALLIAASLIRYPSFQLLIFASLPVLLFTLYHLFKSIHFKKYLLPASIAVIGVLGCKIFDTQYYQQDQDWREFMGYHDAAADVSNNVLVPFEEETKPAFDSAGWSFIDYLMIRNFVYLDPVTYSSENLHKFSNQKKELNLRKYPPVMQARAVAFRDAFTDPVTVICFVAACFFAFLNKKGFWQRSVIKWLLMWSMLIMIGLIIYRKLPERVYIPLSVLPFYYSLLLNLPEFVSNMKKWNYNKILVVRSGVLLLFLAATFSVWKQVGRAESRLMHNAGFKNDLNKLKEMCPDKIFLTYCSFPVGLFLPLENQSEYRGFKSLYLTGRQKSPLFQQNMKAYGIHSPYTELYETDRLLLITHPKMIPVFKLYFKQHYDIDLDFEKINTGEYFHVYRTSVLETKKNDTEYSVSKE